MKLTEYLTAHKLSASAFAQRIGVMPSTVTRLARGERSPSMALAGLIRAATDGAVSADDFMLGTPVTKKEAGGANQN